MQSISGSGQVPESCKENALFDPDPFVIAGLAIATVSMVNGFVQIYLAQKHSPPLVEPNILQRDQALAGLETQVAGLQSSFKQICRTIESGSSNSDGQFYDAPSRVGMTQMFMDQQRIQQLGGQAGIAYAQAGNIFSWSTNLITMQPMTTFNLGRSLEPALSQAVPQVNNAMAEGHAIRVAIREARVALAALETAIDQELNSSSSNA